MSNIFKIYINSYNKTDLTNILTHLFIFIDCEFKIKNPTITLDKLNKISKFNEFIKTEYYNLFENNFNELDLLYANDFNIDIIFIDNEIFLDDTIENLKFKILKAISSIFYEISYEELYLFYCKNSEFNSINIYNNLSNNNKNKISKKTFFEFLSNTLEQYKILDLIEDKEYYTFNDIDNLSQKILFINQLKSIGQYNKNNLNYIINPFHLNERNINLKEIGTKNMNTNNSSMLFENNIINNTLYLSFFNDVIQFSENKFMTNHFDYIIKIYFPLLSSNNINSIEEFNKNQKKLLDSSNKYITSDNFIKKNKIIESLNKIYKTTDKINKTLGINKINLTIHSYLNYNLSLESIFKILNSNEIYPMIKYNPGKKQENIYRLYSKINNNTKIPFLSQKTIIKYSKIMGKTNTISIFVNNQSSNTFIKYVKDFIIEIDITGSINIKIEFSKLIKTQSIEKLLRKNINILITKIKTILSNSNNIKFFTSLSDDNIEINDINYSIIYNEPFNRLNNFNNVKNCFSFLFNIIKNTSINYKELRYKNVSNYNYSDDKTTFIIEQIKQQISPDKIIINLKNNFNLDSITTAKNLFEETIQSLTLMKNTFNYKTFKIKNSPGFFITFENKNKSLTINIKNIDKLFYINQLIIYLESFIKLINNDKINIIKDETLLDICKEKVSKNNNTNYTEDIVEDNNENIIIDDQLKVNDDKELLENTDDENDDNLLNILLDDNSEKDEKSDDDDLDFFIDKEDEIESDSDADNESNDEDSIKKQFQDIEDSEEESIDYDKPDKDDKDDKDDKENKDDKEDKDDKDDKQEENIDTKIGKANPILQRLLNYEKNLFSNKIEMLSGNENKLFTNYSRLCQAKRQPVILTEEEKNKIDNENPGSYNESLEYTTNNKKKYFYICPRFWDIKKNIPITKEQYDSGNYGTLIKKKTGNIMIFDKDVDNHIPKIPGFLKNKTSDNFCLPCCFNKSLTQNKSAKLLKRIKKCNKNIKKIQTKNNSSIDSSPEDEINEEVYEDNSDDSDDDESESSEEDSDDEKSISTKRIYILSEKKMPLPKNKYGDLPIILRNFLQFETSNCRSKEEPNILKYNYRCLLRCGVEKNNNQSFISCISNIYSKLKNIPSISNNEFKIILIDAIDIDKFISYNNGNLTQIFSTRDIIEDDIEKFIIEEQYKLSKFYNILDKENIYQINMYKKFIISYENFIRYIKNNTIYIDYTYLWDIICKPNSKLFENGINLIILDITSEDITENVKIICPKQNYSNEFIDQDKDNIILIKNNDFFEPIYGLKDTLKIKEREIVTFSFNPEKDNIHLNEFKKILNIIKNDINEKCIGKINNEKYTFDRNISFEKIKSILLINNFFILYQIINYEGKIIALIVKDNKNVKNNNQYYIPCYPSSYSDNSIEVKFIEENESSYYNDYNNTKQFLESTYLLSEEKMKIKPLYKIIENEMVVGILTNGNQFVPLEKPEIYINDELNELKSDNYLISDIKIQTKLNEDSERTILIKNINLETKFYNTFRNTLKKELINLKNNNYKIEILNYLNDVSILYYDKIEKIKEIIKNILENSIIFQDYKDEEINRINNVIQCNIENNDEDKDLCNINNCIYNNKSCKLKIPKKNLITNQDNEDIYFTKISDEIIRYQKFFIYLFESDNYINLQNMKYDVKENEIILLQNNINKNLIKGNSIENNFINNSYDTFLIDNNNINEKIDTNNFNFSNKIKEIIETNEKIKIKVSKKTKDIIDEKKKESTSKENSYKKEEKIDEDDKDDKEIKLYNESECKIKNDIIVKKSQQLVNNFNTNIFEIFTSIDSDKHCSYNILITIINDLYEKTKTSINISYEIIKNKLIEFYSTNELGIAYLNSIYHYTKNESIKPNLEKIVDIYYNNKKYDNDIKYYIENIINSKEYYLCYIDLYVISKIFNIPFIFISTGTINIYISDRNYIISNITDTNNYYFIKIPSNNMRGNKNFKLFHLKSSLTINIENNIIDNDNLQLKSQLLDTISSENYDTFSIYIKKIHLNLLNVKKVTKFVKIK